MSNGRSKGPLIVAWIATLFSILVLVGAGWALLNRQFIADQLVVWSFQPTADVVALEERINLTDNGSFYFYASQPVLQPAAEFNESCPRQEPNSPILGCYGNAQLAIYDVTDPTLAGIEEVTAAHEMLHAVWDRLGTDEQERLSKLLVKVYDENTSEELAERVAYYERTQPGEVINELHSILPTEVRDIGPELETYYQKFFQDRLKIVGYYEQYSKVFASLVEKIDTLYQRIEALSADIEERKTVYEAGIAALDRDIQTFNNRADSGDFSSESAFFVERSILISRSNALENDRAQLSRDIDTYNALIDEYASVSAELASLNKSIDSISELEGAPSL